MLLFATLAMSNPTAPQRLFRTGADGFDKDLAANVESLIKRVGGMKIDIRKLNLTVSDIDTMMLMIDLGKLQVQCPGKFKRNLNLAREKILKGGNGSGGVNAVANPAHIQQARQVQQAVNLTEAETRAEQILNDIDRDVLRVIVELYNRVPPAFTIVDTTKGPGKRLLDMIRNFA